MTRTIDELRKLAIEVIETAKKDLLESGTMTPFLLLTDAMDGHPDALVEFDPNIVNSAAAKKEMGKEVRRVVDQHGYFTVVFVTDSFSPGMLSENIGKRLMMVKAAFQVPLADACKMLNIPVHEEIRAMVQSVDRCIMFGVRYRREKLNEGPVVAFEEMTEMTAQPEDISGVMWFMSDRP